MKRTQQAAYVLAAILFLIGGRGNDSRADSRAADDSQDFAVARAINEILDIQTKAWNDGDVDAFMEFYWKSDDLTFSSTGSTTRGWEATKANYKRRYPTRESMGQVAFSEIEVFALGDSAALVLGRWLLKRKPTDIGGNFSLVFRRIDDRWVIIHDHTSRTPEPSAADKEPS